MSAQIRPIIERVRAELSRKNEAVMTWEPIPLTVFGRALPGEIRSAWVFVLRAGADTGAERHPNSHQRMMTFEGSGDMRTEGGGSGNRMSWSAILRRRWSSAGFRSAECLASSVVGSDADWTVVSFHTVPAEELIEEKQDENSQDGTKQMKYLEK